MTLHGLHHLVLRIDDLRDAERFYCELFDFDVLFREGMQGETFGKVPDDIDWDDAIEVNIEPRMSFLGRDGIALALVAETSEPDAGRLDHVAFAVDSTDRNGIAERAAELDCEMRESGHSTFVADRYGVEWELNASSPPPETSLDPLDVNP